MWLSFDHKRTDMICDLGNRVVNLQRYQLLNSHQGEKKSRTEMILLCSNSFSLSVVEYVPMGETEPLTQVNVLRKTCKQSDKNKNSQTQEEFMKRKLDHLDQVSSLASVMLHTIIKNIMQVSYQTTFAHTVWFYFF